MFVLLCGSWFVIVTLRLFCGRLRSDALIVVFNIGYGLFDSCRVLLLCAVLVVFVVLVVFYVLWFDCCGCLLCGVGLTIVDCLV